VTENAQFVTVLLKAVTGDQKNRQTFQQPFSALLALAGFPFTEQRVFKQIHAIQDSDQQPQSIEDIQEIQES